MAIVRVYGKPTLFITQTANPKWQEITDALLPGQQPEDRPDIIVRVFHLKLQALMDDLQKDRIFGRVAAILQVVEFQKRGKLRSPFTYTFIYYDNRLLQLPYYYTLSYCHDLVTLTYTAINIGRTSYAKNITLI